MWRNKSFDELTARELHAIYTLRTAVFVVEQACAYQEVDELDLLARHLWLERDGQLLAYCRLIPTDHDVKLGRVVVAPAARGQQLGRQLVKQALASCQEHFPCLPVLAQAQAHLQDFYASFGFVASSAIYLEDNIPHIDMIRKG